MAYFAVIAMPELITELANAVADKVGNVEELILTEWHSSSPAA